MIRLTESRYDPIDMAQCICVVYYFVKRSLFHVCSTLQVHEFYSRFLNPESFCIFGICKSTATRLGKRC